MKNFLLFFLIFAGLTSFDISAAEQTMFFCCSPEGFCGSRPFSDESTCTQACPGHNRCMPRRVTVAAAPVGAQQIAAGSMGLATDLTVPVVTGSGIRVQ